MANDIAHLTDANLTQLLSVMAEGLGPDLAAFGLSPEDLAALLAANEALETGMNAQTLAEAALRAATQAKRLVRSQAIAEASAIARRVYANSAVNDEMLASIGLTPRVRTHRRNTAKTPTNFLAIAHASGTVQFSWDRNHNSERTIFQVQRRHQGEWIPIAAVTRTRITLPNFPPGTPETFRVVAWANNQPSVPSNEFSIYGAQRRTQKSAA